MFNFFKPKKSSRLEELLIRFLDTAIILMQTKTQESLLTTQLMQQYPPPLEPPVEDVFTLPRPEDFFEDVRD